MSSGFELYQSRVDHVVTIQQTATVHFPHANIYKAKGQPGRDPGQSLSQELEIALEEAVITTTSPTLPGMIEDGYFEVDTVRYDVIPLPLGKHETAHLHLLFSDGSELDIYGKHPLIKRIGKAKLLESFL